MGKLDYDPVIIHFSHEHRLQLSNLSQNLQTPPSCSGCKLKCSSWVYTCEICSYFLHISCSRMPPEITHPYHPDHILTLLPSPAYPEGAFNCNACGQQGTGFCFHCRACELDLHILCASYPLSLSHPSHPCPMNLVFAPPYCNQAFSCDLCNNPGSNHWLYRCKSCEFDAHLGCATAKPRSEIGNGGSNNFRQQGQQQQWHQQQQRQQQQQQWQQQQQQQLPIQGIGTQFRISGNTPINTNFGVNYPINPLQPPTIFQHQQQFPFQTIETQLPIAIGGFPAREINQTNYNVRNPTLGIPQFVRPVGMNGSRNDNIINQMIQGFVEGLSQQAGQNSVQGIFGGGDGGSGSNLGIGSSIINSLMGGNDGGGGGGDIGSSILSSVIGGGGDDSNLGIGASIVNNVIGMN